MNCPSCPLVSNGHNGHIMPFNGQNRHVQWTQWTSIGSILMCPLNRINKKWLINNLKCSEWGPLDTLKWTQWTSIVSIEHVQFVHWMDTMCPLDTNGHDGQFIMMSNVRPLCPLVQWTQSTFLQSLFSKGSVGILTVSIEPMQWTQWTSNANGRPLDITMNCPSFPLVSNGHNGHIVSIQWTKWTCSMDTMDVHWVHFIVSYGPTHCWLHFNLLIGHFVLILFNGNNVSIVCTVSIAHSGHNVKWTQ